MKMLSGQADVKLKAERQDKTATAATEEDKEIAGFLYGFVAAVAKRRKK
jgi:hypothetical protein